MPKPPKRTILFLCCFLFSGLSIKFNPKLNLLTIDKELIQKAENLLKDADCVIANHSDAMGAKKSKIAIVEKKNVEWLEGSKNILSRKILEKISTEF